MKFNDDLSLFLESWIWMFCDGNFFHLEEILQNATLISFG